MTHSSPSRTAVVRIAAGVRAGLGLRRQNAGDHSPLAHFGRQRSFISSEPNSWIGSVPSSWTMRISALDAHALRDLLDRDLEHQRPGAGAAVLLGERQGEDVLLGEQPADVPRVLALAVDLGGARARRARRRSDGSCRGSPCAPGGCRRRRSRSPHASIVSAGMRAGPGYHVAHGLGTSLFLIAVGAILRYAVSDSLEGIDIPTIGLILMIVGIVGLLISLFTMTLWDETPSRCGRGASCGRTPRPVVSRPVRLIPEHTPQAAAAVVTVRGRDRGP